MEFSDTASPATKVHGGFSRLQYIIFSSAIFSLIIDTFNVITFLCNRVSVRCLLE